MRRCQLLLKKLKQEQAAPLNKHLYTSKYSSIDQIVKVCSLSAGETGLRAGV